MVLTMLDNKNIHKNHTFSITKCGSQVKIQSWSQNCCTDNDGQQRNPQKCYIVSKQVSCSLVSIQSWLQSCGTDNAG